MLPVLSGLEIKFLNKIYKKYAGKKALLYIMQRKHLLSWDRNKIHSYS